MKNSKFNQVREIAMFGDVNILDVYEDSDQCFDNFVYEMYGSAASTVLINLNSFDAQ